jgi:hypothetical protein
MIGGMISTEDFLWFVDDAVDGMVAIVTDLGDDLANRVPDLPGANPPYALLHHCLGVMEWWSGHVVAGRDVARDRAAEFTATGPVDELVTRARAVRDRFAADVAVADPFAPPARPPVGWGGDLPLGRRQGAALVHVYEELAQHRGQMEVTRDVLRASWAGSTPVPPAG